MTASGNRKPGTFAMVPIVATLDTRLKALHWRAMARIAFRDRGKGCGQSIPDMANEIGCNRANLAAVIAKLILWDYVTSIVNPANKRQRIYRVRYDDHLPTWQTIRPEDQLPNRQPIKRSDQLPNGQPINLDQLPKTPKSVAQKAEISCPASLEDTDNKQQFGPSSDIRQKTTSTSSVCDDASLGGEELTKPPHSRPVLVVPSPPGSEVRTTKKTTPPPHGHAAPSTLARLNSDVAACEAEWARSTENADSILKCLEPIECHPVCDEAIRARCRTLRAKIEHWQKAQSQNGADDPHTPSKPKRKGKWTHQPYRAPR